MLIPGGTSYREIPRSLGLSLPPFKSSSKRQPYGRNDTIWGDTSLTFESLVQSSRRPRRFHVTFVGLSVFSSIRPSTARQRLGNLSWGKAAGWIGVWGRKQSEGKEKGERRIGKGCIR
ncbi:hypothetical protein GE21DRAFT_1045630 [Neurospora crassa]|nr:hypothetical protein GE21DRAFT_1045630 [Neurospora crassa]